MRGTVRQVVLPTLELVFLVGLACENSDRASSPKAPRPGPPPPAHGPALSKPGPAAPDLDAQPQAVDVPFETRAIQFVQGAERIVDGESAALRGLTIVDLSDDWSPYIFNDGHSPDGTAVPNRYRAIYIGLANERTDGEGQALPPGARNYLELYGIPPSLSVIRKRFLADEGRRCEDVVDAALLLAVEGVETWGATTEKKELQSRRARGARLELLREKAGASTLEALAVADPTLARDVAAHLKFVAERRAFAEVEKRLACEGLMDPRKHKEGLYDTPMRLAMLDFQQRNALMDQADITRPTLEALAHPIQVNNFATLRRVVMARAVHAAGVLEDGSAGPVAKAGDGRRGPTYKASDGARLPVPDLVSEVTEASMARMGLFTPEDALAFFRRHPPMDFQWLKVVARFPRLPEYYSRQMDLSVEIDRGDVWLDFPFNQKGQRIPQPREHYPALTLFVRWQGEKVPLVRWRTTVGGWRSEVAADGEEYYRYKDSDVGPRVWHHIVAAPVWIPPPSAPLSDMVKTKWVNGAVTKVTNYDETGPGYLSAYGLAAAIHVEMRRRGNAATYLDNGIRTHGSFDYMSLRGRFSHGCHRLANNLAVRLFSFILTHRRAITLGPMALNFRRTFWSGGEVFDMRLPTRGFYFELDPPLPVETLEGQIKGVLQKPVAGYVRKPGVTYATNTVPPASNTPESKAGGDNPQAQAPPPGEP